MSDGKNAFGLLELLVLAIVVLIVLLYQRWGRVKPTAGEDGPLLSSGELLGAGGLQSLNRGNMAGFSYDLMTNDSGRVMLMVQLGHNNWSHIIAYGDRSRLNEAVKSELHSKWLQRAVLEGDFPDYFHMYCNPEAQVTVREVFAPDVMANFVDFCRAYDFEIFHDTLYLSLAQGAHDNDDSTTMVTDATRFLSQNKNGLARL